MRRVLLETIGTFDRASFERFQTELIKRGFEPTSPQLREWVGPVHGSFRSLTDAVEMRLEFRDGWPFKPPRVYVDGLTSDHVNPAGEVCLWREDEGDPKEWVSFDAFESRLQQWCDRVASGFSARDIALDAHLYFDEKSNKLAILNISEIVGEDTNDGAMGHFHAVAETTGPFNFKRGIRHSGALRGRWYYRRQLNMPPANLLQFRNSLRRDQATNFERLWRETNKDKDTIHFALLIWNTPRGRNALALCLIPADPLPKATALVAAPTDTHILQMRAGPDAALLKDKRVVLFGVGAIGSHLALLLAESGIGNITIVDGDVLRPGDVTRHAAGSKGVGYPKVDAVKGLIADSAPWTNVHTVPEALWHPDRIVEVSADADLVIDGTGIAGFTDACSVLFGEHGNPFLTYALYRSGSIGRARRQAGEHDTPIMSRIEFTDRYPLIPPDDEAQDAQLETGCTSPVNNAPPHSVLAIAVVASQYSIDWLSGRMLWPDEVIDVYNPIANSPFEHLGRLETR